MSTSNPTPQNSTGPRPATFRLGIDSQGYEHWRHVQTQRIELIDRETGERVNYEFVPDGRLDDWMAFVDDDLAGGWAEPLYGQGLVQIAARALDT